MQILKTALPKLPILPNDVNDMALVEIFDYYKYTCHPFVVFFGLNEFIDSDEYNNTVNKLKIEIRKQKLNKLCINLRDQ